MIFFYKADNFLDAIEALRFAPHVVLVRDDGSGDIKLKVWRCEDSRVCFVYSRRRTTAQEMLTTEDFLATDWKIRFKPCSLKSLLEYTDHPTFENQPITREDWLLETMTSEDGDETEDRCFLRTREKRKILRCCKTDFISAATCDRVSLNTVDILATDWMFLPAIAGKELCVEFEKYGKNGDEPLQQ